MLIRSCDSGNGESTCGGSGGVWRKRKYISGNVVAGPHWLKN